MKGQEVKGTVDKEVVLALARLIIHELKRGEREKIMREADLILAKYGKKLTYFPSVMEVMLDGKWGKGEK